MYNKMAGPGQGQGQGPGPGPGQGQGQGQCRICYEETPPLLQPCKCKGTIGYVHEACVIHWLTISGLDGEDVKCELCRTPYNVVYKNEFERVFDIMGEDYYMHMCPLYNSIFAYFIVQLFIPSGPFLLDYKREEMVNQLFVPVQYSLFIVYRTIFFYKARIQNWRLYWIYLVGSGYINIICIYLACLLIIPYNGIYGAVPANVLQPAFFYIHNVIAKKINSENTLVFR